MKNYIIRLLKLSLLKLQPKERSLTDFSNQLITFAKERNSNCCVARCEITWMGHRPDEKPNVEFSGYVAGNISWQTRCKTPEDVFRAMLKMEESFKNHPGVVEEVTV